MKLSIFTTIGHVGQNLGDVQDAWKEAIANYIDLADEVVIINGNPKWTKNQIVSPALELWESMKTKDEPATILVVNNEWEKDFSWERIGEQFNLGWEICTGDWVIRADLDYFFHEGDYKRIRQALEKHADQPAISMMKKQFLLVDRYRIKSRLVLALNKAKFGDRIKLDSGGDLCQPSLDGMELKPDAVPFEPIPFYNYDFSFKDKETIGKEFHRMAIARSKVFTNDDWGIESDKQALEKFKRMQTGKFDNNSGWEIVQIDSHPKFIQEKIKNIKFNQFGFNMFGWVDATAYVGQNEAGSEGNQ